MGVAAAFARDAADRAERLASLGSDLARHRASALARRVDAFPATASSVRARTTRRTRASAPRSPRASPRWTPSSCARGGLRRPRRRARRRGGDARRGRAQSAPPRRDAAEATLAATRRRADEAARDAAGSSPRPRSPRRSRRKPNRGYAPERGSRGRGGGGGGEPQAAGGGEEARSNPVQEATTTRERQIQKAPIPKNIIIRVSGVSRRRRMSRTPPPRFWSRWCRARSARAETPCARSRTTHVSPRRAIMRKSPRGGGRRGGFSAPRRATRRFRDAAVQ